MVAEEEGGRMGPGHARLRLLLVAGAFALALLPNFGTPAVAAPRASGRIVANDVVQKSNDAFSWATSESFALAAVSVGCAAAFVPATMPARSVPRKLPVITLLPPARLIALPLKLLITKLFTVLLPAVMSRPSRMGTPELSSVASVRQNRATAIFRMMSPSTGVCRTPLSSTRRPFSVP